MIGWHSGNRVQEKIGWERLQKKQNPITKRWDWVARVNRGGVRRWDHEAVREAGGEAKREGEGVAKRVVGDVAKKEEEGGVKRV